MLSKWYPYTSYECSVFTYVQTMLMHVSGNCTERHRGVLRQPVYEPQTVYLMGSGPFPNIIPPKYACTGRQLSLTDQIATACHRSFIIKLCPSSALLWYEINSREVELHGGFSLSTVILTTGWFADKRGRLCLDPTALSRKGQNKSHTQVCELPLQAETLYYCNSSHCPHSQSW